MVIELYDNKKFHIKSFIIWIGNNKRYFFIYLILRGLSFFIIINLTLFLLPIDIFYVNSIIKYYLQVSLLKKLMFYSILGDVFTDLLTYLYVNNLLKCDAWADWDAFVRANPTVIMPPDKYHTLSALDPNEDRNQTLLWYKIGRREFGRYSWASYHPNRLRVFERRSLLARNIWLDPWPLPECRGLYFEYRERSGPPSYVQLDTSNSSLAGKPLYAKTTGGEYFLTPFSLQHGIKRIRN
jgi:hypothetical protein